ncbi:hypothetical protein [Nocardiopsis flavescens]
MAVAAAMTALGLAALVALPGIQAPDPGGAGEVVPGAETLHLTLAERAERDRLRPGDRVEYTIGVRNSGVRTAEGAEVVHILPPTMRYVTGTEGAEVDGGRVVWTRSLEAGERAAFTVTGELTGLPEGAGRPVATACLRSAPDGVLASCAAQEHEVRRILSPALAGVVAGALALLALAGGGIVLYRRRAQGRERPGAGAPVPAADGTAPGAGGPVPAAGGPAPGAGDSVPAAGDPAPEPVPGAPGATVHHLDVYR